MPSHPIRLPSLRTPEVSYTCPPTPSWVSLNDLGISGLRERRITLSTSNILCHKCVLRVFMHTCQIIQWHSFCRYSGGWLRFNQRNQSSSVTVESYQDSHTRIKCEMTTPLTTARLSNFHKRLPRYWKFATGRLRSPTRTYWSITVHWPLHSHVTFLCSYGVATSSKLRPSSLSTNE